MRAVLCGEQVGSRRAGGSERRQKDAGGKPSRPSSEACTVIAAVWKSSRASAGPPGAGGVAGRQLAAATAPQEPVETALTALERRGSRGGAPVARGNNNNVQRQLRHALRAGGARARLPALARLQEDRCQFQTVRSGVQLPPAAATSAAARHRLPSPLPAGVPFWHALLPLINWHLPQSSPAAAKPSRCSARQVVWHRRRACAACWSFSTSMCDSRRLRRGGWRWLGATHWPAAC